MKAHGFTLVELVVAMAISAILVGFIAALIGAPVDAYIDQSERAEISHSADTVSRSLSKDLGQNVLPNSVRISSNGLAIELLHVTAVSFYVPSGTFAAMTPPAAQPNIELDLGVSNERFQTFGQIGHDTNFLVTGHTGSSGANAYAMQDVIVSGFTMTPVGSNPYAVQIELATDSLNASDDLNRIFWVSEPVTYICDAGNLRRFNGYAISSNIATSATSPQLTSGGNGLITKGMGDCRFRCESVLHGNICQTWVSFEGTVIRTTTSRNETIRIIERYALDNRS